jgi:hypothetical protein
MILFCNQMFSVVNTVMPQPDNKLTVGSIYVRQTYSFVGAQLNLWTQRYMTQKFYTDVLCFKINH